MLCFIRLFQKNVVYFILLVIVSGLIFGQQNSLPEAKLIKQIALYIMLIPVFINLDFVNGLKEIKHFYKVIGMASLLNLLIYPLIAYFIGFLLLEESPAIWFGLVLMSLVPTSGMTINWTNYTKGNMSLALAIISTSIIMTFFLLPLLLPVIAEKILTSSITEFNRLIIIEKLAFAVLIPLIIGFVIRNFIISGKGKEFFASIKPLNSAISNIGLLIITFVVSASSSSRELIADPEKLMSIVIPVVIFYVLMFLISHYTGNLMFKNDYSRAFFFSTASRYHVIVMAIAFGVISDQDVLNTSIMVIAASLVLQIVALAFYARIYADKDTLSVNFIKCFNSILSKD